MSLVRIETGTDEFRVSVSRALPTYARGAALTAVMAYPPTRTDDPTTLRAYNALCRVILHQLQGDDPDWFERPQIVVPMHLTMSVAMADNVLVDLQRRLEERLGAAHVAAAFLQEAEAAAAGQVGRASSRPQVQGATLDAILAEEVRRDVLGSHGGEAGPRFPADVDNFETRVVRANLPVIHLAFATAQAIERSMAALAGAPAEARQLYRGDVNSSSGEVRAQMSIGDLLSRADAQDWVVGQAEKLESLLPHLRHLRPRTIVRFRFV